MRGDPRTVGPEAAEWRLAPWEMSCPGSSLTASEGSRKSGMNYYSQKPPRPPLLLSDWGGGSRFPGGRPWQACANGLGGTGVELGESTRNLGPGGPDLNSADPSAPRWEPG